MSSLTFRRSRGLSGDWVLAYWRHLCLCVAPFLMTFASCFLLLSLQCSVLLQRWQQCNCLYVFWKIVWWNTLRIFKTSEVIWGGGQTILLQDFWFILSIETEFFSFLERVIQRGRLRQGKQPQHQGFLQGSGAGLALSHACGNGAHCARKLSCWSA